MRAGKLSKVGVLSLSTVPGVEEKNTAVAARLLVVRLQWLLVERAHRRDEVVQRARDKCKRRRE